MVDTISSKNKFWWIALPVLSFIDKQRLFSSFDGELQKTKFHNKINPVNSQGLFNRTLP